MITEDITKLQEVISELKSLACQAKTDRVKDLLAAELKRCENSLKDLLDKKEKAAPATSAASKARAYDFVIKNYSWDQSDKFVKIYLTGLEGM